MYRDSSIAPVEEEDAVTTATKGGQHKEMLDRVMGQRLDSAGVEKHMRRK